MKTRKLKNYKTSTVCKALGVLALFGALQAAQAFDAKKLQELVVPIETATNDEAFGSGELISPGYHLQTVYSTNQFPGEPILITELHYRPDYYYGFAFSTTISDIQISLSTITAGPGGLSPTFADNIGANNTTIVNGSLSISSSFIGPATGPKDFDIVIPLAKPFFYDPRTGNLLVDVQDFSGSSSCPLSGESTDPWGASRVGGSLSSPTGFPDGGGEALQIVYMDTTKHQGGNPPPPIDYDHNDVLPNILMNSDQAYGSGVLSQSELRVQEVYASSQLPTFPIRIKELRFRPDYFYGNAFSTTVSNIQINLSTTPAQPDALSGSFADNVGANDTIVFDGAANISSSFTGPADGPKDFDITFTLATPFDYDPSQGNLLVDIRNYSGSNASLASGSSDYGDGASRVVGDLLNPFGFADTGADAIEIDFDRHGN